MNKNSQKKLINLLNSFDRKSLLSILIPAGIFGFYFKIKGKITCFAGGRKKTYYIKYGKYSKSNRILKVSYNSKQTSNMSGAVGIGISITYL